MARILIAEDEERIAAFLEKGLSTAGFSTDVATDGAEALRLARSGRYSLLLLDLGLPGIDGLDVLQALRGEGRPLPVIVVTARAGSDDQLRARAGGASDYVTKPFRFDELLARIRSRLGGAATDESDALHAGDATLEVGAGRLQVGDRSFQLGDRELDVAAALFRRAGQVLTRAELLSEVWGYDFDPGSKALDAHVGSLRRKLGRGRITTVRRIGYRLETRPVARAEPHGRGAATPLW